MGAMIEPMESRLLLAGQVVALTLMGTAGQITGVVMTFDTPLDPASAQNPKAYQAIKKIPGKDSNFGVIDTSSSGKTRRVRFTAAAYAPATQSVTLTPSEPFDLGRKFRRILIDGAGPDAIHDATGAAIDGNGDGVAGGSQVIHSRVKCAGGFTFREADGDKATLKLRGPGTLRVWSDRRRGAAPIIFLVGTDPARSTLTGSVMRNRRHGDGVATIRQISGTTTASVPLLTDPAFVFQVVSP